MYHVIGILIMVQSFAYADASAIIQIRRTKHIKQTQPLFLTKQNYRPTWRINQQLHEINSISGT